MHGVPLGHTVPQVPQLEALFIRSTHCVPHALWPLGQASVQCPATQDSPDAHAAPQPPQLLGSLITSAHSTTPPAASHGWSGQLLEQEPLTQY